MPITPSPTPGNSLLKGALGGFGAPKPPMHLEVRTFRIDGRRTSARLEAVFWQALDEICAGDGLSLSDLATRLAADQTGSSVPFASTLRVYAVTYFREAEA